MARVRVKGLKEYFEPKVGKVYRYHRKTGIRIHSAPGSPEFFAEIAAAQAKAVEHPPPATGTLERLMEAYRASPEFRTLRPRTKTDYEKVMGWLKPLGEAPIASLGRAEIAEIRDTAFKARKRSFANYVLAVLSILFNFAIERGEADDNPVSLVKKVRRRVDEVQVNRPWSAAERATVIELAPLHLGLPIAIGRWTGLREGDVLRLPKIALDGATVRLRTSKRGVPVSIPIAGPLRAIVKAAPAHNAITLCVNSRGAPWTESGFRASLFKFLRQLEREGKVGEGLTFHGLRHSVATDLRELGFDTRTIADLLGQKTLAMAEHYARDADLSMKLEGVIRQLESAHTKGTKLSRGDK